METSWSRRRQRTNKSPRQRDELLVKPIDRVLADNSWWGRACGSHHVLKHWTGHSAWSTVGGSTAKGGMACHFLPVFLGETTWTIGYTNVARERESEKGEIWTKSEGVHSQERSQRLLQQVEKIKIERESNEHSPREGESYSLDLDVKTEESGLSLTGMNQRIFIDTVGLS